MCNWNEVQVCEVTEQGIIHLGWNDKLYVAKKKKRERSAVKWGRSFKYYFVTWYTIIGNYKCLFEVAFSPTNGI